jgi:chromosome segregation ATPase
MSTTSRHDEWVRTIASSLAVQPITLDDLPPLSGERVGAAMEEAEAARERAEERHAKAEAEVQRLAERRDELTSGLEHGERTRTELREELRAHAEEAGQLRGRLAEIDADSAASEQELDELQVESDALYVARQEVARVVQRATGAVSDDDLPAVVTTLEEIASSLETSAEPATVTALRDWAEALREGTAPLASVARELLEELQDLERERAAMGGDVSGDPEVTAARAEMLGCQTTLSELEQQERTGVLGERSRRAIEDAHARRLQVEASRRAGREELDAALDAELEALAHVGFDSMLDFRIVMSSTGVATLATKRREVAEERLAAATVALDAALATARSRRDELEARRATVLSRAAALVRGSSGDPDLTPEEVEARLARWYEVPPAADRARQDLAGVAERLQREISRLRCQGDDLAAERVRVVARLAESAATGQDAQDELDRLEAERTDAAGELEELQVAIAEVERERERTAMALRVARDEVAALADRGYLDADVADRRTALVQALRVRAEPDGDPPAGVVLDDPLVDLAPQDALTVLGALSGIDWGVEVHLVTSRKELLSRTSRRQGSIRVHDARKRIPRSRWVLRSRGLLAAER